MRRLLQYLLYLIYRLLGLEAVRLNLYLHPHFIERRTDNAKYILAAYATLIAQRKIMAKIGDTFTATIKPTNAAGNPAPVFNAVYDPDVDGFDGYDVTIAPDGLSAVLVAKASGTGFHLRVSALTKSGKDIVESVALPDVEAPVDEEAVALNLTVA